MLLPGVGSFDTAMKEVLNESLQLLTKSSEVYLDG